MRIKLVQLVSHQPHSEDIVELEGESGIYTLTGKQIQELLIEDGQMCEYCLDSGEVEEGQFDDVRVKKCICKIEQ